MSLLINQHGIQRALGAWVRGSNLLSYFLLPMPVAFSTLATSTPCFALAAARTLASRSFS